MVQSMTGFGRGASGGTSVELRSVNSRYLEVSVRGVGEGGVLDGKVRGAVRAHISRGKVSVGITREGSENTSVQPDLEKARAWAAALREVGRDLELAGEPDLAMVAGFRDIFSTSGAGVEDPLWEEVAPALQEALDAFTRMRATEGEALAADVGGRLENIGKALDGVEERAPQRSAAYRERLWARIQELMEQVPADETRVAQEIVLYADRIDISEECTRLRSHLAQAAEMIAGSEPSGRPLNFLLQEIHREVNTIGSKANEPEISLLVVGMKEELEKMREQVQNIE